MAGDTFGEHYFEWDSTYTRFILKGLRSLTHKLWVTYLRKHKWNGKLLDIVYGKGFPSHKMRDTLKVQCECLGLCHWEGSPVAVKPKIVNTRCNTTWIQDWVLRYNHLL